MIKCAHVRPRFSSLTEVEPFILSDLALWITKIKSQALLSRTKSFFFFPKAINPFVAPRFSHAKAAGYPLSRPCLSNMKISFMHFKSKSLEGILQTKGLLCSWWIQANIFKSEIVNSYVLISSFNTRQTERHSVPTFTNICCHGGRPYVMTNIRQKQRKGASKDLERWIMNEEGNA